MTFKPALWHPIAVVLSAINLAAAGFAAASAEPWHATAHVALAAAFAVWAQRLRQAPLQGGGELDSRVEALEFEMSDVRRELGEAQERLDFAERVLAKGQEVRREETER
jgi:hypothetical protein